MSGSRIIPAGESVDAKMEQFIPFFGLNLLTTSPTWWGSEVDIGCGSEAGKAVAKIPLSADTDDESAFSLVFNPEGELARLKGGDPMAVIKRVFLDANEFRDELVFVGEITLIEQILAEPGEVDALQITGKDIRHMLQEIRTLGRWVYSTKTDEVTFQEGLPEHINPEGEGNCVFDASGNPWFAAVPETGLEDDDQPPDASEGSTEKTCYWTFQNFLRYKRNTQGPEPIVEYPSNYPYMTRCPGWLVWPESFGSNLDSVSESNFNDGVGQNFNSIGGARKGPDMNFNGYSMSGQPGSEGWLDMILEAAGGWTWTVDYQINQNGTDDAEYQNVLKIVPSRWRGPTGGVNMPYAAGGAAKDTLKSPAITGGRYVEDFEQMVTRAVGSGSIKKIETRCSTRSADHGGTAALIRGYTDAQLDECLRYAVWLGGGHVTPENIEKAFSKYYMVLASVALNPNFDFTVGTQEEGAPRARVPRPVWPLLLSFQGNINAVGDILPYPIRSEVYNDDEDEWSLGTEFDGLEVWDNGIIYVPGLRDDVLKGKPGTWRWANAKYGTVGTYDPVFENSTAKLDIVVQDVRMTLAIPCDSRFTYAAKVASDIAQNGGGFDLGPVEGDDVFEIINDGPDVQRCSANFSRTIYLDLNNLYELWMRVNSWPLPESQPGSVMADDKPAAGSENDGTSTAIRDDSKLLRSHVIRRFQDNARIDRTASELFSEGWLVTSYAPGTIINQFTPVGRTDRKPWDARCVVLRKKMVCNQARGVGNAVAFRNITYWGFG